MNVFGPRRLHGTDNTTTDKYHYACANTYRIAPVGYCALGCEGHETAEQAREHFREYLVNEQLEFRRGQMKRLERCRICSEWTASYARIDGWDSFPLCDHHLTKESVSRLLVDFRDFALGW